MMIDKVQKDFSIKELEKINTDSMTPMDKKKLIKKMEREMKQYAEDMNFEIAIMLRDKIRVLKEEDI